VASFQWGSEGGVMALWFGSTHIEEGGSRRHMARQRYPKEVAGRASGGGRCP
jgi:hypothetical protein